MDTMNKQGLDLLRYCNFNLQGLFSFSITKCKCTGCRGQEDQIEKALCILREVINLPVDGNASYDLCEAVRCKTYIARCCCYYCHYFQSVVLNIFF
jgi:hypothetical protein